MKNEAPYSTLSKHHAQELNKQTKPYILKNLEEIEEQSISDLK